MADDEKKRRTISKRQSTLKKELLERLSENGNIQSACRKIGIGRKTCYRWREEDIEFERAVLLAIKQGREVACDISESALMNKVAERDLGAIKFHLTHNHPQYMSTPRFREHPRKEPALELEDAYETDDTSTVREETANDIARRYEVELREAIIKKRLGR